MRPDDETDQGHSHGHGLGDPEGAELAGGYGDEAISVADGAEAPASGGDSSEPANPAEPADG